MLTLAAGAVRDFTTFDLLLFVGGLLFLLVCFLGRTRLAFKGAEIDVGAGNLLWDRMAAGAAGSVLLSIAVFRAGITLLAPEHAFLAGRAALTLILGVCFYSLALWVHDVDRTRDLAPRVRLLASTALLLVNLTPLWFGLLAFPVFDVRPRWVVLPVFISGVVFVFLSVRRPPHAAG